MSSITVTEHAAVTNSDDSPYDFFKKSESEFNLVRKFQSARTVCLTAIYSTLGRAPNADVTSKIIIYDITTVEDSGDLQSMENSSDRFFKGFSLEHYRLQVIVNSLEKEKKQCLNRLKGETHVFKMSARLPVKREEGYWNQYGEIFHANGDRRGKASVTHLSAEHNKEGQFTFSCYCFFTIFSFLVAIKLSFLIYFDRKVEYYSPTSSK